MTPHAILNGTEETLGEFFVHNDDARNLAIRPVAVLLILGISLGEIPAGQERHVQRREISRANPIHESIWRLGRLRMIAFDGQPAVRFIVLEDSLGRNSNRLNAWNGSKIGRELAVKDLDRSEL